MCFKRIPRFLYQDRCLLSFPASRSSSNSSYNIPRCDANEPILFFSSQRLFSQYIFGQVIHGNHHKYLSCSLLLPFSSHSRLISSFKYILKAASFHLLSHLIIGTYCGSTTGRINRFLRNFTKFIYIFDKMHVCINILQIMDLRRAK